MASEEKSYFSNGDRLLARSRMDSIRGGLQPGLEPKKFAADQHKTSATCGLGRSVSSVSGLRPVIRRHVRVTTEQYETEEFSDSEPNSMATKFERGFAQVERRELAVSGGTGRTFGLGESTTFKQRPKFGLQRDQEVESSDGASSKLSDSAFSSRAGSTHGLDDTYAWIEPIRMILEGASLLTPNAGKSAKSFQFPDVNHPLSIRAERTPMESFLAILQEIGTKLASLSPSHISALGLLDFKIPHYDAYNSIWAWMCHIGIMDAVTELMDDYAHALGNIFGEGSSIELKEDQDVIVFSPSREVHCRGVVYRISSDEKTARVHLVDYGNIEPVPRENLRCMPMGVKDSLPNFARRCRMREIDYGFQPHDFDDFKLAFNDVINSDSLRGRIIGGEENFLEIDLEYGPYFVSANPYLQGMGFQHPLVVMPPRFRKWVLEGIVMSGRLMHVQSPSIVWVWSGPEQEIRIKIGELGKIMQEQFRESLEPITIPEPGFLVAVLHNGSWFRARVLSVNLDYTCTVLFLDFGKMGVTTFASVRPLSEKCAEIGALALQCRELDVLKANLDANPNALLAAQDALREFIRQSVDITVVKFRPVEGDAAMARGSDDDTADIKLHLPGNRNYCQDVEAALLELDV